MILVSIFTGFLLGGLAAVLALTGHGMVLANIAGLTIGLTIVAEASVRLGGVAQRHYARIRVAAKTR